MIFNVKFVNHIPSLCEEISIVHVHVVRVYVHYYYAPNFGKKVAFGASVGAWGTLSVPTVTFQPLKLESGHFIYGSKLSPILEL